MAEAQTWRVVLATGEVLSVEVQELTRGRWVAVCGHRETFSYATPEDALRAFLAGYAVDAGVREILAPGEPTRAELVAELAVVTRERDEMAARHDDARADYAAVNEYLGGIVRVWQRASGEDRHMADTFVRGLRREIEEARDSGRGEWWEACRGGDPAPLRAELAVLRAQQAPLVACVDALRAAARAAGWHDADATGETLVAWVRRGGACEGAVVVRDAAMSVADDLAGDVPEASDEEWAHELMHRVAAAVAQVREGGE